MYFRFCGQNTIHSGPYCASHVFLHGKSVKAEITVSISTIFCSTTKTASTHHVLCTDGRVCYMRLPLLMTVLNFYVCFCNMTGLPAYRQLNGVATIIRLVSSLVCLLDPSASILWGFLGVTDPHRNLVLRVLPDQGLDANKDPTKIFFLNQCDFEVLQSLYTLHTILRSLTRTEVDGLQRLCSRVIVLASVQLTALSKPPTAWFQGACVPQWCNNRPCMGAWGSRPFATPSLKKLWCNKCG